MPDSMVGSLAVTISEMLCIQVRGLCNWEYPNHCIRHEKEPEVDCAIDKSTLARDIEDDNAADNVLSGI